MNANTQHHDPNAVAHDVDNTIDRALSALRDAEPRSGLNGRILASLERRTTEPGGLPFHNVKGWGIARGSARENSRRAHLALWAATSAVILAITSMMILHHHVASTGSANVQSAATRPQSAVILSEQSESKNPDTTGSATNPEPFSITNRHPERRVAKQRPPAFPNAAIPHTDGVTPTDAQLLADLHAPSHPAPPLPLTPQEKLFLRTLRYGNLTQLAELDPAVRAQRDDAETAAFKAFFPDPPPPLDQPGDTNDSNQSHTQLPAEQTQSR